MASVSATLIVRDEERFLASCLSSIRDAVDEIIVVDTGSVDRTREIALAGGARLLEFPWIGDFAAARNFAIDAARGDWILYIDADERLRTPLRLADTNALIDPHAIAATVRFRPFVRATPYREHRLFRNDPRIRFHGAIHETIVPALRAVAKSGAGHITDADCEIVHLGYEGDLTRKHHRNLPLLRAMVAREPGRLYCWYDLARTLVALGNADEAIEVARRGLDIASGRDDMEACAVGSLIAWTLAQSLRDRNEDAMPVIDAALVRYPGQVFLLFLKARVLVDRGLYDEALGILDRLLARDPATFFDPLISYDERIFGCFALELSAVALLRLGRRGEAARAFSRASAMEPAEMSYRAKAVALGGAEIAAADLRLAS
ncbi:MAG: glycosyltransferase [Hyphomicrobium sp.]